MERDAVEIGGRLEHVRRTGHQQLLRCIDALIADDVALQVQLDLRPDADREYRHLDPVELLEGRPLLPERIVERMLVGLVGEIPRQHLGRSGRRILVQRPQLAVIPGAGELARNAARIGDAGVSIDQPVIRGDAGEMRRVLRRHEPLRHRVVRLPDAADLAVRPRLLRNPFDHVEEVGLFLAVEEAVLAVRTAGAAHVHMHERITVIEVPLDRTGLTPQELRRRRQQVVVEPVRRRGEERRVASRVRRQVDRDGDGRPIAHADILDPGRRDDVVVGRLHHGCRAQRSQHQPAAGERLEHRNLRTPCCYDASATNADRA